MDCPSNIFDRRIDGIREDLGPGIFTFEFPKDPNDSLEILKYFLQQNGEEINVYTYIYIYELDPKI